MRTPTLGNTAVRRFIAVTAVSVAAFVASIVAPPPSHAAAAYQLNIGSLAPKGTPWWDMLLGIEATIESGSKGQIDVIIRPPGVISEVEMVRETRSGERLQGCGVTTAAIAEGGNIPTLQLVELPYLFKDSAEADYILDNVLFTDMNATMGRRGFVLASWSENGWRNFATKGKPIRTPADLKGMKMRSQESDVHMAMYTWLGANAVEKPMTEVLTSLQSNVVDGLDTTALYIQAAGIAESIQYYTLSRHIYQPAAIIVSKAWYDKLPPDLQKVVSSVKSVAPASRAAIRMEEKAMIDNFPDFGVKVVDLTDAEREEFAKLCRPHHQEFAATIDGGAAFLAKVQAAIDTRRATK